VLVVPGDVGTPPPLSALSSDPRVLHTVRDGGDVVLVPLEPDGRAIAEELALRSRDAGRTAAFASPADSATSVPAAYRQALDLPAMSPALRVAPVVITAEDALPERLLGADPDTARRLVELVDRLAGHPGLVDTVAAFLDADMDRSVTADRLHIHRRTVTQRLHRVRELAGYDPRSTRGVQVLGLALAARGMSVPR
jgi:sugar diacid utilization regulator